MARKKIDQEPIVSAEGSAAAPAKAPASASSGTKKNRAPRSSAKAAHRHKTPPATESQTPVSTTVEDEVEALLTKEVAYTPAAPIQRAAEAPTYDEIAVRAYLLAEARGFENGNPEDNWFAAETQLLLERAAS